MFYSITHIIILTLLICFRQNFTENQNKITKFNAELFQLLKDYRKEHDRKVVIAASAIVTHCTKFVGNYSKTKKPKSKLIEAITQLFDIVTDSFILYAEKTETSMPYVLLISKNPNSMVLKSTTTNQNPLVDIVNAFAKKSKLAVDKTIDCWNNQKLQSFLEEANYIDIKNDDMDSDLYHCKDNEMDIVDVMNSPIFSDNRSDHNTSYLVQTLVDQSLGESINEGDMELDMNLHEEQDCTVSPSPSNGNRSDHNTSYLGETLIDQSLGESIDGVDMELDMNLHEDEKTGEESKILTPSLLSACGKLATPDLERIRNGRISDDEFEVGKLFLINEMKRSGVHCFPLVLCSTLFDTLNYEIYIKNNPSTSIMDINKIDESQNLGIYAYPGKKFISSNMFSQKLLLFPVVFMMHYSLIIFVRPDLYCKGKSCLIWLDSYNDYHKKIITQNMLRNLKR